MIFIQLYDTKSLKLLKTFKSDRPINSAAITPSFNHVVLGGGQEAQDVTNTGARSGKFEAMFYSTVFEELVGTVKGHFGPINTLALSPDGKRYFSLNRTRFVVIS